MNGATIQNLTISGAAISNNGDFIGALAGYAYNSTIENCNVNGTLSISGKHFVGGAVGFAASTDIKNCDVSANGTIKADDKTGKDGDDVGGVVGYFGPSATLLNSDVTAKEGSLTISGVRQVGGLAGLSSAGGTISTCNVTGVTVESITNSNALNEKPNKLTFGGLVGGFNSACGNVTGCTVSGVALTAGSEAITKNVRKGMLSAGRSDSSASNILPAFSNNTVEIIVASQLQVLAEEVNSWNTYSGNTVILSDTIDLSSISDWTPIGYGAVEGAPIDGNNGAPTSSGEWHPFSGTFDGKNKTIKNLSVKTSNAGNGLFGVLNGAIVKDLVVEGATISCDQGPLDFAGAIAGYAYDSELSNIDVKGELIITGSHFIGGVVGFSAQSLLTDCDVLATGTVKATDVGNTGEFGDDAGGIAGYTIGKKGDYSLDKCDVTNSGLKISAARQGGGLVGLLSGGSVVNACSVTGVTVECAPTSTVANAKPKKLTFGGFAGAMHGAVTINDGSVTNVSLIFANQLDNNIKENTRIGKVTAGTNGSDTFAVTNADQTGTVTIDNVTKPTDGKPVDTPHLLIDGAVAVIGDTPYASLKEAVEAADSGDTIELIADDEVSLTKDVEIVINKSLTITGAVNDEGKPLYTVYGNADSNADSQNVFNDIYIGTADINVTISNIKLANFGNKKATNTGNVVLWVGTKCTGKITIDNVSISDYNSRAILLAGGNFEVKNTVIDCASDVDGARIKGIEVQYAATGTISDCTISGMSPGTEKWTTSGVEYWGTETVTVKDCEIQNMPYGISTAYYLPSGSAANGTIIVDNCTVSAEKAAISTMVGEKTGEINQATLIVNSGIYSGEINVVEYNGGTLQIEDGQYDGIVTDDAADTSKFTITGGIYNDDPSDYVAEGYAVTDNKDTTTSAKYPKRVAIAVASITTKATETDPEVTTYYATIEEAVKAAAGEKVIKLLAAVSYDFNIGDKVIVDETDYALTATTSVEGYGEPKREVLENGKVQYTLGAPASDDKVDIKDDTDDGIKLTALPESKDLKDDVSKEYSAEATAYGKTVQGTDHVITEVIFTGTTEPQADNSIIFDIKPMIQYIAIDADGNEKGRSTPKDLDQKLLTGQTFKFNLYLDSMTGLKVDDIIKVEHKHEGTLVETKNLRVKKDDIGRFYVVFTTREFSTFTASAPATKDIPVSLGPNVSKVTISGSTIEDKVIEGQNTNQVVQLPADETITISAEAASSNYNISISTPTSVLVSAIENGIVVTATKKNSGTGGGGSTPIYYTLSVTAGTGGTVSPSGTNTYDANTTVSITATPSDGYEFSGWSGDATGTSTTTSVTMTGNKSVTATFKKKETTDDKTQTFLDDVKALPDASKATSANRAAVDKALKDYADVPVTDKTKADVVAAKKTLDAVNDAVSADEVADKIEALPKNPTLSDKDKVEAARKAYDALTEVQKKLVPTADVTALENAEKAIKQAEEDKTKADEADKLIKALPASPTLEDKDQVAAAKKAYDDLTKAQQALVPEEDVTKLNNAVKAIEEAEAAKKEADQKAAKAVEDLIKELPDPANVTSKDKAAIEAVKKQYDALTPDQQALIDDAYKTKLQRDYDAIASADQKIAERFTAAVKAVPGAPAGTEKGLLDKATAIYKELTEAQKALVSETTMDLYKDELAHFTRNYTFRDGNAYYKVLSNGDVTYLKPTSRNITSASVPEEAKDGNYNYRVIKISNNAFRN